MSEVEIKVGQLGIRYLIDGSQSESLGMFELSVPPASNVPPPHSHSNNEELVYVLEGTLRYTVGRDTRDLAPGQSMHTSRGTVHAFSNLSCAVGVKVTADPSKKGNCMPVPLTRMVAIALVLFSISASGSPLAATAKSGDNLAGAWRGKVQFRSGALADTKDLEFMYAFDVGGTMTESSNYDAAPPVPPAYGAWKKVGARKYEARYEFFQSKAVTTADEFDKGGKAAVGGGEGAVNARRMPR